MNLEAGPGLIHRLSFAHRYQTNSSSKYIRVHMKYGAKSSYIYLLHLGIHNQL